VESRKRGATLLLALAAGTGCPRETPGARASEPWTLRVLATGDVGSDTDVCGCKVRRLGGLARRAALVRARPGALVVDVGDLFFRRFGIDPRRAPQARATAELHADALRLMGASAMAVGERDLTLGVPYLRALGRRAGVALLSANLVHAETGTAAFPGHAVVRVRGRPVGLVGVSPLLAPGDPAWPAYAEAGVRAAPPVPAARAAAEAAREAGAQALVGLFHVGRAASERLVASLPPGLFDLVLVAGEGVAGRLRLGGGRRTALLEVGERGKYLADVRLRFEGGDTLIDRSAVEKERALLEALEDRIAGLAADGARAGLRGRLERRAARMRRTLRAAETARANPVSGELVPVREADPRDPAMAERYAAYQDALAAVNAAPPSGPLGYVGHERCGTCHASALEHWRTTGHAEAWATMVETKQTGNLDCIPCHVTGFEQPGGPRRLADLDGLRDVGCEACHGPGRAHAEAPEAQPLDPGVAPRVCATCHQEQGDQKPFVLEERLPRVLGPGHGGPREAPGAASGGER
jgi:hypothetical protein